MCWILFLIILFRVHWSLYPAVPLTYFRGYLLDINKIISSSLSLCVCDSMIIIFYIFDSKIINFVCICYCDALFFLQVVVDSRYFIIWCIIHLSLCDIFLVMCQCPMIQSLISLFSLQVMAVKKQIEEIQGKDTYPCGQQLLIHQGKVLKDDTTIEDNQITENGFLVVMLTKVFVFASYFADFDNFIVYVMIFLYLLLLHLLPSFFIANNSMEVFLLLEKENIVI